ncbi:MAG: hypothetical protein V1816_13240 [Pseudomonadota bacterium]
MEKKRGEGMAGPSGKRKIVLSLIIAAALATAIIPSLKNIVYENRVLGQVDRQAEGYVEASFQRALAAYALARGLNMIISVIQESTVDIQPFGLGVSAAVGQILDPINDLVERFSWVMLVSLASLGVQKLLIEISPWISVNLLLTAALFLWLAGIWLDRPCRIGLSAAGKKVLFAALVLRFCVPLAAYLNEQVYVYFLEARYQQASGEIEKGREDIQALDPFARESRTDGREEPKSWWGKVRAGLDAAADPGEWKASLTKLKEKASGLLDHIIDLIVVFVLGSIFLPIAFLWGLVHLFRTMVGGPGVIRLEEIVRDRIAPPAPRG